MRSRDAYSIAVAVLMAAVAAGCDGPPNRPSHLDSFRMTGPAEVPPGSSASYKALLDRVATLSDVTEQAAWTSTNPSVLSVDSGLAVGRTAGESVVSASFEGQQTDPALVMVLPAGTYRLRGTTTVVGNVTTAIVVPFARVEVPAVGLVTTADSLGRYVLYGVPPDAEIRATRDGFAAAVTNVHLVDHFAFVRITMRAVLEGTFTLSIRPGTCSDGPALAANLLQRTYTVALAPASATASTITGTFPGATGITVVQFFGTFTPQGNWNISFVIGEQLPDGKVLTLNGFAPVRASDLVGTFSGRFAVYDPATGDTLNRCTATGFPFVLTP